MPSLPTSQKRTAHPLLPTSTFLGDASRDEKKKKKKERVERRTREGGEKEKEGKKKIRKEGRKWKEAEKKRAARRLTASTETFKSEEARGSICNSHVSAKLSGQPVARILTALHPPDACWVKVKLCERKLWKARSKKGWGVSLSGRKLRWKCFHLFLTSPPPSCLGINGNLFLTFG